MYQCILSKIVIFHCHINISGYHVHSLFILWERLAHQPTSAATHSKIQDVDQEIGGSLLHNLTVLEAWKKHPSAEK